MPETLLLNCLIDGEAYVMTRACLKDRRRLSMFGVMVESGVRLN